MLNQVQQDVVLINTEQLRVQPVEGNLMPARKSVAESVARH